VPDAGEIILAQITQGDRTAAAWHDRAIGKHAGMIPADVAGHAPAIFFCYAVLQEDQGDVIGEFLGSKFIAQAL